jgi:Zn-dependent membrane protease YugP
LTMDSGMYVLFQHRWWLTDHYNPVDKTVNLAGSLQSKQRRCSRGST